MDDKTKALVERLRLMNGEMRSISLGEAADTIEAQAKRIEELEEMCRALAGKDQ